MSTPLPSTNERAFPVFSFTWGMVILFGMSSEKMGATLLGVLVCLSCFAAMLRPNRPWGLLATSSVYLVHFMIDEYRIRFVHTFFDFCGCSLVLLGLLASFNKDESLWRQQFVKWAGPASVGLASAAFFFAGFGKLNFDYFTPASSCGVLFYEWQRTVWAYGLILPTGAVGDWFGIVGTLIAELLAPFFWMHHRTRKVGFFLGLLLMFLLGTNPYARYYVFTGPFIALVVIGFDWERPVAAIERILSSHRAIVPTLTFVSLYALVVAMTVGATREGLLVRHFAARTMFILLCAFMFTGVSMSRPIAFGPVWKLPLRRQLAWAVVLFVVGFELLPYFGMRHARNFTMAANFRLDEGHSNHLLVRSPLPFPMDKKTFAETFGWKVPRSRPKPADCGKRRVHPDDRNVPGRKPINALERHR